MVIYLNGNFLKKKNIYLDLKKTQIKVMKKLKNKEKMKMQVKIK